MSVFLASKITSLPGIGPKYAKLLEKLDITTIKDLLYHLPYRYETFVITKSNEIAPNTQIAIEGTLKKIDNIYTARGKKLTTAKIEDTRGTVSLIWFNQQYLKNQLTVGRRYLFFGKVSETSGKVYLVSPSFDDCLTETKTEVIRPIYPSSLGVSSTFLHRIIQKALILINQETPDPLPKEIRQRQNLPAFTEALYALHNPKDLLTTQSARKRFEFEEILLELLTVEASKQERQVNQQSQIMKTTQKHLQEFIESLPFKLTETQLVALEDIQKDLSKPIIMNRLVEGDVGSGKTVIAAIAAYICFLNELKAVYMAPTELLANQHFQTFAQLFTHSNLSMKPKIELLTSKTSKNFDQNFDILIGTHAILYSNLSKQNLGLVIVDEQHKFGVDQRAALLGLTENGFLPNILTMTATPIPRSLALTIYGDVDISQIDIIPTKKRAVISKVITQNQREKMYSWIKNQNKPTFIVCPFIEESNNPDFENVKAAENEFMELQKIFPVEKMALLHSKMKSKDKELALENFRNGYITYLVSTPVVEVGIDVADAVIMVVESAQRYGLASLHQLRGRVGRSGEKGWCFLVYDGREGQGLDRIKHLETKDNGLELAELDLKLRGEGDIFGTKQSGFKKFRYASLYDIDAITQAKKEVNLIYPTLANYPELHSCVEKRLKGIMSS